MLKKNQLMITALAIMLAIAGYLQFAEDTRDGEKKSGALSVDYGKVITENYVSDAAGDGILSE
ncbi:MAG: SpoIIIAH-like family protein, partial [Lachnospiraceae bacterium]|nr:SpoIIIAH-like family protein [Lachnospiraceae bacterium]